AGVGERARDHRVERTELDDRASRVDEDVRRQSSVPPIAPARAAVRARAVLAPDAPRAGAARARRHQRDRVAGREPGDARAELVDPTADLVTKGERHLPADLGADRCTDLTH